MSARPIPVEVLEVHLEELGQHSWVKALFNTLTGSYGSAQFRFVARPAGAPDDQSRHVAVSGTFPVMRFADLDDEVEPNTWLDLARGALDELDLALTGVGWRRRPDRGKHWWSLHYDHGTEQVRADAAAGRSAPEWPAALLTEET